MSTFMVLDHSDWYPEWIAFFNPAPNTATRVVNQINDYFPSIISVGLTKSIKG